jgi:serine/threonine protein kinase/WD40 repeat protein/Flp pilus assembly protein TadD
LELAEEFLERYRKCERPPLREYIDRHPELAQEIKEVFPAMAMMENIAVADESMEDPAAKSSRSAHVSLKQLGDYRIIREIGRGGMGVVYEAEQVSLGRHVALKLLPNQALQDIKHKRRFEREARAAAKLHHTNIVPVFGVGDHDGVPYYVMQFIQGLGLDVVLRELNRLQPGAAPTHNGLPTAGEIRVERRDVSAVDMAHSLMTGAFQSSADYDEAGAPKPSPPHSPPWHGGRGEGDVTADHPANGGPQDNLPSLSNSGTGRLSDSFTVSSSSLTLPGSSDTGSKATRRKQTYWQSVANIGRQVAEALDYAHKQGIQHRDVKPSNLLLDMRGTVWVTDFGLAKLADPGVEDITHTGDLLGTMRYMPPEAFEGKSDARGDVYSLGLTLYELLAMRPAFNEKDRNKLIKQVTTGEPTPLENVRHEIPRDLVTIIQKSIAREPSRRYATAAELAADLQRFLDDEPIQARRQTQLERCVRWARHHPGIAIMGGVLTAVLVMATIASLLAAGHFNQLRHIAKQQEVDATLARDNALQTRNAAARQAAGLLLDKGIEDARNGEPARALHLFVQALRRLPADDPQAAALERMIRMNLSTWAETVPALEHILPNEPNNALFGFLNRMPFSPDGTLIGLAVGERQFQCYRTDTGRPTGPPAQLPGWIGRSIFAADGRSVWVESTNRPGTDADGWAIFRIDPETGRSIQPPISTNGPLLSLLITPDGHHLVGAVNGIHPKDTGPDPNAVSTRIWRTAEIVVWDTASGRVVRKENLNGDERHSYMGLSANGETVTAWVPRESGKLEGLSFTVSGQDPPKSLGLHPWNLRANDQFRCSINFQNNMRTAIVVQDGQAYRWSDTNPGALGPGVPAPFLDIREGSAPDGRSVISAKEGRIYDTGTWPPRPTATSLAHPGMSEGWGTSFGATQYSFDGRFIASGVGVAGFDRRLWRLPRPHSRPAATKADIARIPEPGSWWGHQVRFDQRVTCAILNSDKLDVRLVDLATGGVRATSMRHAEIHRNVAWHPSGKYFATASNDATARVWETATGRPAGPSLQHKNHVSGLAFSPDGNMLATGDYGPTGQIKFWDWQAGKEARPGFVLDDIVFDVSFSPDGHYLAAIKTGDWTAKHELLLWDVATGQAVMRAPHMDAQLRVGYRTFFRPDGRAMVARNANGMLIMWEVPSGRILAQRALDGSGVNRFSPDGRIVAATERHGVRLLDAETLAPLPGGYLPHPDAVHDVAFSPDGAFLLSGRREGSAQLWDVATRKPVGPPAVLIGGIFGVTFSCDGKTCIGVAADGTVRRWPVPAPVAEPNLERLADRVALMTGQRMDENQGLDYVPTDDWRKLQANLVGDGSTALVAPRADADWHDARAADAEQDGDSYGAEWHLDRLTRLRPNDWVILARLGRVLAAAGRRDEADVAYATARRLAPSPQVLADWLRVAASVDETEGRKAAALWNLDRAIVLTPDDWTLYAARAALAYQAGQNNRATTDIGEMMRRGANDVGTIDQVAGHAGESGDWKRAAALFQSVANQPALTPEQRYHLAIASQKAGDAAAFHAACTEVSARTPPIGPQLSRHEARRAAMVFALQANAANDWNQPIAWIDHALIGLAAEGWTTPALIGLSRQIQHMYLNTRGTLLYRAGRFEESVKAIREAMTFHTDGGAFHDWAILALVEQKLGHADSAKEAAAKARAARAKTKITTVWDKAEVEMLAAELDAALPASAK